MSRFYFGSLPTTAFYVIAGMFFSVNVVADQKIQKNSVSVNANSAIRVICDDSDNGAEIYINGKFKGECPVDASVDAGAVRIKVIKKIDADYEPQIFESEIKIGNGVVKKIEVKFPPPKLSTQGLSKEEDSLWLKTSNKSKLHAYIEKYPNGKYTNEAWERLKVIALFPNPDDLPFKLDHKVWDAFYKNKVFWNMPNPKKIKIQKNFAISINKDKDTTKLHETYYISPMQGGWIRRQYNATSPHKQTLNYFFILGGLINIGIDTKSYLSSQVEEVRGELFPLKSGNHLYIKFSDAYEIDLKVGNKMAASSIDERLKGEAWEVETVRDNKNYTDYFLEEYGLFLSMISMFHDNKFVIPKPGSVYVEDILSTTYTFKYTEYNFNVDN